MDDLRTAPDVARELLASGRALEAIELLRQHLEAEPLDARAWNDVAEAMISIGEGRGAVPAARQAWVLSRTPESACLMAVALTQAGRAPDALQLLEAAIQERPQSPRAWERIARCLELMGAHDSAVDARWQAWVRAPRDLALGARIADRLERGGRRREARQVAEQVLAAEPRNPLAQRVVVRLEVSEGKLARASERVRGLLLDGDLPASATSGLWKDLARIEAARGKADDAFMAATVGNAQALLAWTLAHGAPPELLQDEAREMLEATPHEPSLGPQGAPMVGFLVGFPCPALEDLRGRFEGHPEIVTVRDPVFEMALAEVLPAGTTGQAMLDALAEPGTAAQVREVWRREVDLRVDAEGKHIVDASPLNALRVDALAAVFPGAPLLGILRDPRDAVLDAFLADFDGSDWAAPLADLPVCAEVYAALARLWSRARDTYAVCTDLRYEAVDATPRRTLTAALARLGLEFDEAVLEAPTGVDLSVVGAVSFGAIRSPRRYSSIERWPSFQAHLLPVLPTLAEAVHAFGYAGTPQG